MGGDNVTNGSGLTTIFSFNFSSEEFEYVADLAVARKNHTATVLDDESVLVVGGWSQSALKHVERITLD